MSSKERKCFSVDFRYFGRTAKVDIDFSPELFVTDSSVYSVALARLSANLTLAGYDLPPRGEICESCGIHKALSGIGMDKIVYDTGTGPDEVDSVFASMNTEIDGEQATIVFVCFTGSHHAQWYTNFESGTGTVHEGFTVCENNEYAKLESYLENIEIKDRRTVFLIVGHSRGAATAGILAHRLTKESKYAVSGDIFAYTFASPAYFKGNSAADSGNIFNFINEEDFVVQCMPKKWGYCRYGTDIVLPNKRNCNDFDAELVSVNRHFSQYTDGETFTPFAKGPAPVDKLIDKLCKNVSDVEEYYRKEFRTPEGKMSLKTYFAKSLCTVTAETDNPEKSKPGLVLMLKTSLFRFMSADVVRAVSDFFILYEGLGGVTKGKCFRSNVSQTHEMSTYCAFIMAMTDTVKGATE